MNFSSNAQDVIARSIDIHRTIERSVDIEEFYELDSLVAELVAKDYRRIALQFPDELLNDSVLVFSKLKSMVKAEQELYILADTTYASCCVDEIAARHIDADVIVHFGHACMGQLKFSVPIIYIFGKQAIDLDNTIQSVVQIDAIKTSKLVLRFDVVYAWQAGTIVARLQDALPDTHLVYKPLPTRLFPNDEVSNLAESIDTSTILYIGPEGPALTHLLITHGSCQVYSYDPQTKNTRLESSRTNKMLMRRYAMVQKAKDADVFGILVGSFGGTILTLLKYLRKLFSHAHKKSYTVSVGKITPAKLANFLEIECWVYVSSCGEGGIIDSQEFYKPLVTPYELQLALTGQPWTGRYVLDAPTLLYDAETTPSLPAVEEDADEDGPVFSTVTGKYRHPKRFGAQSNDHDMASADSEGSTALTRQNNDGTVSKLGESAAAQFLQNRSYRGLEVRLGEDEPSTLEQGRSGIARGYGEEREGVT